jgi:predicted amidohydrolase YtcJ
MRAMGGFMRPYRTICAPLAALLALALTACPAARPKPPPPAGDLVLRGGVIFTAGANEAVAEAMVVRGGRIAYAGSDVEAARYIGPATRVIELAGKFVMPGIVDGHVHPLKGGQILASCSLAYEALTRTQLRERVAACLAADPGAGPNDWLEVWTWQAQGIVPAGARVTKKTLDRIDTPRPILVRGADGHTALANSRALELAGITADTLDPLNGKLLRDKSGAPNGYLVDVGAIAMVASAIPALPPAELQRHLAAAHAHMLSIGVTAYLAAAATPDQLAAWMPPPPGPRAHLAIVVDPAIEREANPVAARVRAVREGMRQPSLRVDTIKFFLDGVMEYPAQTAALLSPYLGGDDGELYADPGVLARLAVKLEADGWQLHFHTIGDRAVRPALDAIEGARTANGPRDARHTLTHLELVDPADVSRFAALGAVANFSPQWAQRDAYTIDTLEPYIGSTRHRRLYPIRDLLVAGARVSFGSDWPVDPSDRFDAIETAVTRERASGGPGGLPGVLGESQRIALVDALRAYTASAAYQLHREAELGALAPGLLADFIVLDANPFAIAPSELSELRVLETWMDGVRVYDAAKEAAGAADSPGAAAASEMRSH